ncbi:MAG TPA: hypothetical protein VG711_09580 [Phycisphaerales bacterium]|nr:hypothetical protein [Phycisphaerales bacterium]
MRGCGIVVCFILSGICSVNAMGKARQADFNGDGRADLAIGTPFESVGGHMVAGGVAVIYGKNSNGLNASGDQFWTADSSGVNGASEDDANFGRALAAGDFDGDGYTDLAIGVPGETVGGLGGAGGVEVLYGSSHGLSSSGDQLWTRNSSGVLGDPETNASFGQTLTAGDFNGDGRDDLAIGVPHATVNGHAGAGEIHILYGGSNGLKSSGDQIFNQETAGIDDLAEDDDAFGSALCSGDFDHDGKDDLAIGVPYERLLAATDAGVVHILYGTSHGLDVTGAQYFGESLNGVPGVAGVAEYFGFALAAGDFDHNGKDDLAVGVPGEDVSGEDSAGMVYVFYGSSSGLKAATAQRWTQDSDGVKDSCEANDNFGWALAAGDFDNDGRDDLAIGVPYEDLGGVNECGAVNVLYGASGGLKSTGNQFWNQDSEDIKDSCATDEDFGYSLAAGDFDHDGRDDLAVGVPYETVGGHLQAGGVNVIYGHNSNGLNHDDNQFWTQDSSGINDSAQTGDVFGLTLR